MVYAPVGRPFTVRMNAIGGPTVTAWWFNSRDGRFYAQLVRMAKKDNTLTASHSVEEAEARHAAKKTR
jgi:Putative collagen-binding domain of a collagenase